MNTKSSIDNDCSIKVYQSLVKIINIMLVLCFVPINYMLKIMLA